MWNVWCSALLSGVPVVAICHGMVQWNIVKGNIGPCSQVHFAANPPFKNAGDLPTKDTVFGF